MGVISESEKGSRLAERFAAVAEELNNTFIWRIALHLAAKYEQTASKVSYFCNAFAFLHQFLIAIMSQYFYLMMKRC